MERTTLQQRLKEYGGTLERHRCWLRSATRGIGFRPAKSPHPPPTGPPSPPPVATPPTRADLGKPDRIRPPATTDEKRSLAAAPPHHEATRAAGAHRTSAAKPRSQRLQSCATTPPLAARGGPNRAAREEDVIGEEAATPGRGISPRCPRSPGHAGATRTRKIAPPSPSAARASPGSFLRRRRGGGGGGRADGVAAARVRPCRPRGRRERGFRPVQARLNYD